MSFCLIHLLRERWRLSPFPSTPGRDRPTEPLEVSGPPRRASRPVPSRRRLKKAGPTPKDFAAGFGPELALSHLCYQSLLIQWCLPIEVLLGGKQLSFEVPHHFIGRWCGSSYVNACLCGCDNMYARVGAKGGDVAF